MTTLNEREWDVVEGNFLFESLDRKTLRKIVEEDCLAERFEKDDLIFAPDRYTPSLVLLLKGRIQVRKGEFQVSILGPGELFGAAALYQEERGPYVATLTAKTVCKVLCFPEHLVKRLTAQYPGVAAAYIRYLSDRVRFLQARLDDLLAGSAEERLKQYLRTHYRSEEREETRWAWKPQEDFLVELDCPVSDLAACLNVSRAALYRAFDAFTAAGLIEKQGKTIRILDMEELLKWY